MILRILVEVNEVIDKKVRPIILKYNSNVKIKMYYNGTLEIYLTGACSTCPSQKFTVSDLILKSLKEEVPEVRNIIVINS